MPDNDLTSVGRGYALKPGRRFYARMFGVKVPFLRPRVALGCVLLAGLALAASAEIDAATRAKAVRVETLIDKIKAEAERAAAPLGRREAVTEDELNAYIACQLFDDREPVLKELRFKLVRGNRFEGMTVLDFGELKVPGPLRGRLNVYFGGRLETREGAVRLAIGSLFINGQQVRPEIFDAVISIGSRLTGTEPFSLRDWYLLPYGIRDLAVDKGRLLAFYAP